ncbi:MAG: hypothetical protein WBE89_19520, partial [Methyloceanibacter sp.]
MVEPFPSSFVTDLDEPVTLSKTSISSEAADDNIRPEEAQAGAGGAAPSPITSDLGNEQTSRPVRVMSVIPLKAEIH